MCSFYRFFLRVPTGSFPDTADGCTGHHLATLPCRRGSIARSRLHFHTDSTIGPIRGPVRRGAPPSIPASRWPGPPSAPVSSRRRPARAFKHRNELPHQPPGSDSPGSGRWAQDLLGRRACGRRVLRTRASHPRDGNGGETHAFPGLRSRNCTPGAVFTGFRACPRAPPRSARGNPWPGSRATRTMTPSRRRTARRRGIAPRRARGPPRRGTP